MGRVEWGERMRIEWRSIVRGVAGLAALTGSAWADDGPRVLHIVNRPDFIAEDTVQKFSAETGIKVTYDTEASDEAVLAALKAGNQQGWDLVVTSAVPNLLRAIPDHLLQPIDAAKLSNLGNLDPEIQAAIGSADPGNKFGVPYLWGTSGLGINSALLKQTMPDAPTDSLALVFDPALAAQLAACGVAMEDGAEDAVPAALAFLGLDPASQDEHNLAKAAELLTKLKPYVKRLAFDEFAGALGTGKICVGFGPSTAVSDARTRADDLEDGPDITYVIPKEHARRWVDVLAIPAGAAHADAAYQFINFLLRPEIISDITDWTGAANPNILATDFVDDDDKSDETVFPAAGSRAWLFLDKPMSDSAVKARQRLWARTRP
jgi:putrescine transport system substrate-binding protein